MLAEHLYQLGHRKLVFISTPFNQLTLAREQRLEGIRKQLELHGVTDGLEVLVADRQAEADSQDDGLPYEYSVGRQLTAELIRRESMATAPVSYTHLDVYKRQRPYCATRSSPVHGMTDCSCSANTALRRTLSP